MQTEHRKVIRSYRLVFRRRWRIFRIQGWRIPLPGGLELRAVGYWLCCLAALALLAEIPLLGLPVAALPPSLRLLALPLLGAWALSRWEVDGRSPHRALLGLLAWRLRPRTLAGLRRCPAEGIVLAPLPPLTIGPDLRAPRYPRGAVVGPARLALRYPVRVTLRGARGGAGEDVAARIATARCCRIEPLDGPPFHRAQVLDVPAGREVSFR